MGLLNKLYLLSIAYIYETVVNRAINFTEVYTCKNQRVGHTKINNNEN